MSLVQQIECISTIDYYVFTLSLIDFIEEYLEQENSGSDLVICAHYLRKAVREIGHVSGKVSSEKIAPAGKLNVIVLGAQSITSLMADIR